MLLVVFFFFKQKTAYEMRISDWSSDVCSSDLLTRLSCLQIGFRIEQAMKVDDDIAHFGIVDRPLRAAAPGFFGSLVVGIDPDHVQLVEIDKIQTLGVGHTSAENEMQLAVRH